MLIHIGNLQLNVSILVLVCICAGVGLLLIILILCCCWCCFGRRDRKHNNNSHPENPPPEEFQGCCSCCFGRRSRKHNNNSHPENLPPGFQGNRNGNPGQSPLMPDRPMGPTYTPPPSRFPTPSIARSTCSNPLPPQQTRRPPPSLVPSFASSQTIFTHQELVIATNGFSKGNILGEGGFGVVHKGMLPDGKPVAVKSLKSVTGQGEREFKAEVEIISRVHHRHLVSLVGFCNTGKLRLLVYELVPNKTLEFHLHGNDQQELDWPLRMKIAIGAAKGLAYLHEDCHPRIIHRDIKASNILLDDNFEAKVADFGLAKFYSKLETHISTRVMGSLGYIAPEYVSSGQLTAKSDVYSYGVLLLELITGRKPYDKTRDVPDLVQLAKPMLTNAMEDENFNYLADPRIQYCFKHTEMARMVFIAAACVRKSARRRPRMSQIVRAFEGNMSLADLTEGITSDISSVERNINGSEYSGSEYKGDSTEYESTAAGGMYPSSSSGDAQTTRELDSEEVKREIIRSQRPL